MSADVEHITCQQFVEVLTDYLEGAVDAATRAEIERHIVICRGCSTYVDQMHTTIDLLGRLATADEEEGRDGGGAGELLELLRAWKAGREP
jgi:hypothetical protein